jgi:hypothetical protein
VYDIATGVGPFQITNNKFDDMSPQTDGKHVVWLGFSQPKSPDGEIFLPGGEIFLYVVSNGQYIRVTTDTNVESPPQIAYGNVVWTSHQVTDSVEPGEVFLYNTANETISSLSASVDPDALLDDCFPRISGESVVWVQADDIANTTTVFIHDLTSGSTTKAPQGFVWEDSSQTDGDLTVKVRQVGNDREIFLHNSKLKNNEQITDNDFEDRHPSISGNTIAWVGGDGENAEIFLATYDVISNPPVAHAGDDQVVAAGADCTAFVTLDGSNSNDPDNDPLSFNWTWADGFAAGMNPTIELPLGVHTITLVVNDGTSDSEPDTIVITVSDNTPPDMDLSVSPDTLWPPNHKMVLVTAIPTASDNCNGEPVFTLQLITMNEGETTNTYDPNYDSTVADGHTMDDIQLDENGDIYLRAERTGTGTGRVYTITYTATDASGNSSTASATVTVPHNQ